ncbi:hypothetical protein [Lysinibacillus sp. BW-2-10]|uniref:hypothetical protein n=1 Tax=Lysinibacillus sp. BW-2-10 TaxID=2590030 RepID=UPI00117C9F86|nr:hypothetical protein [Lysinibacillus sp. BW-2-10]TSI10680.1 hypothetical protein FJQ64_03225 [Lysinibacillus sp. BW-2-10]
MKHNLVLYVSICLMQLTILTNITLLNGEWNGITMFLCTSIFVFASAVFGLSRQAKNHKRIKSIQGSNDP